MKKLLCAFYLTLFILNNAYGKSAVTYTLSGGRLGDNLLAYAHAKWISFKYQIPLLYVPFDYSDQLMLHVLEEPFTNAKLREFESVVDISKQFPYTIEPDKNILYIIPYFPDSIIERSYPRYFFFFDAEWTNYEFKQELKRMICPRNSLSIPKKVDTRITVALHVRVGTGFDCTWDLDIKKIIKYLLEREPYGRLKQPPLSYYIEQLQALREYYPDQPLYIHLFTDHTNPQEIAMELQQQMNDENMFFVCRASGNRHDRYVLEDFFAMTQCDCLIRPDSNFSLVSSKLGDYQVAISPWHQKTINDNDAYIDEVRIDINKTLFIKR